MIIPLHRFMLRILSQSVRTNASLSCHCSVPTSSGESNESEDINVDRCQGVRIDYSSNQRKDRNCRIEFSALGIFGGARKIELRKSGQPLFQIAHTMLPVKRMAPLSAIRDRIIGCWESSLVNMLQIRITPSFRHRVIVMKFARDISMASKWRSPSGRINSMPLRALNANS
jgi:hypothetical protein